MAEEDRISRFRANLVDERDSAHLYRVLAELESDERLSAIYGRLAKAEEKHTRFWEERLRKAGGVVPARRVGWRARVLGSLARRFGPSFVLPTLDGMERADTRSYDGQPEAAGTELRRTSARTPG